MLQIIILHENCNMEFELINEYINELAAHVRIGRIVKKINLKIKQITTITTTKIHKKSSKKIKTQKKERNKKTET